jgi:hypothetical protein
MRRRAVFKELSQEEAFQKLGYIKISFLSNKEVQDLLKFYHDNTALDSSGFQSTHFSKNREYKRKVQATIENVFSLKFNSLLVDYKFVFGNFMVKNVGAESRMPIHADWTYVNEDQFQSLGIWCPLVDTTKENGMLGVVPYSHNLDRNNRGPKIPNSFQKFDQYIIDAYGKLIPMKAGEIILYDHRLLHFSPPNESNEARVAINVVACPRLADVFHYAVMDKEGSFNEYHVREANFFVEYDHFERPDLGTVERVHKLNVPELTQVHIDRILNKRGLLNSLKSLFTKN